MAKVPLLRFESLFPTGTRKERVKKILSRATGSSLKSWNQQGIFITNPAKPLTPVISTAAIRLPCVPSTHELTPNQPA
jgi:hypothetical protein